MCSPSLFSFHVVIQASNSCACASEDIDGDGVLLARVRHGPRVAGEWAPHAGSGPTALRDAFSLLMIEGETSERDDDSHGDDVRQGPPDRGPPARSGISYIPTLLCTVYRLGREGEVSGAPAGPVLPTANAPLSMH